MVYVKVANSGGRQKGVYAYFIATSFEEAVRKAENMAPEEDDLRGEIVRDSDEVTQAAKKAPPLDLEHGVPPLSGIDRLRNGVRTIQSGKSEAVYIFTV